MYDQFGNLIQAPQQQPQYAPPQQFVPQQQMMAPQQPMQPQMQPVVRPVVKSRPAPVQQVPQQQMQPVQQMMPVQHVPVQQVPVQQVPVQVVPQQQLVEEEPPVYYEEQPQYVEVPVQQPVQYVEVPVQYVEVEPQYAPEYEDIEPTETDFDGAELDEGTVLAPQYKDPVPVITQDKLAQKEHIPVKVVKSGYPVRKTVKNVSPRITAMPTVKRQSTYVRPNIEEQDFTHDDWKQIQKKIDKQYEKKLKQVGDDALAKLKTFQAEHKALLEKTQYLIEHSRIEDEEEDEFIYEQPRQAQTDRNRFFTPAVQDQIFQEEFTYKPKQVKTSAKGPQVIRKSAPPQQPVYSAPQQKQYVQQPMQPVKQFVQQPVYQQPVQYVPQQQPVYAPPAAPSTQQYRPPVKSSPVRKPQSFAGPQGPPRGSYPDTYSERPRRQEPSFQQRPDPRRNTVQKQYPRNKSAPRDPFRDQPRGTNPNRDRSQPRKNTQRPQQMPPMQPDEEPICVLKVELDGGQNVQLLRVFEGQIPEEIVEDFGQKFNVSENAKHKLLSRIYEQLQQ